MNVKTTTQKIEEENEINTIVKQVLLGSLMGDGSLVRQKESQNAYYREIHSTKQRDYIFWKKEMLSVFETKTFEYSVYDHRTHKTYYCIQLRCLVHPVLTKYHSLLYKTGRKSFPQEFLKEVGPLGLAVWYMDDGFYHYGDGRCGLSTDTFSQVEHLMLKEWLKKSFNVESQIYKRYKEDKIIFSLAIPASEAEKFLKIIEPFVIPSMYYKLGHLKEENFIKLQAHKESGRKYRKLRYEKFIEQERVRRPIYYEQNKESILEKKKEYYQLHREEILEKKKEYHKKYREFLLQKQKVFRIKYPEKIKERSHRNYLKNREKILERSRKYLEANKGIINQRRRDRYRKNKEMNENGHILG